MEKVTLWRCVYVCGPITLCKIIPIATDLVALTIYKTVFDILLYLIKGKRHRIAQVKECPYIRNYKAHLHNWCQEWDTRINGVRSGIRPKK